MLLTKIKNWLSALLLYLFKPFLIIKRKSTEFLYSRQLSFSSRSKNYLSTGNRSKRQKFRNVEIDLKKVRSSSIQEKYFARTDKEQLMKKYGRQLDLLENDSTQVIEKPKIKFPSFFYPKMEKRRINRFWLIWLRIPRNQHRKWFINSKQRSESPQQFLQHTRGKISSLNSEYQGFGE